MFYPDARKILAKGFFWAIIFIPRQNKSALLSGRRFAKTNPITMKKNPLDLTQVT